MGILSSGMRDMRNEAISERDEAREALQACVDLFELWREGLFKQVGIRWESLDDAPPAIKRAYEVLND